MNRLPVLVIACSLALSPSAAVAAPAAKKHRRHRHQPALTAGHHVWAPTLGAGVYVTSPG